MYSFLRAETFWNLLFFYFHERRPKREEKKPQTTATALDRGKEISMKVVGATGYVYYPVKKREARILKTIRRKVIWHWEKIRIRKAVVKNWPSILAILAMSQMYRFSFFQEPDMNFCLYR